MKRTLFFGAALIAAFHAAVTAQVPGRSVNMVSGTTLPDGDPFLQRQNEPSGGVSTRNPLHLLAGANDYRTVDIPGLPDGAENGDAWLGVFKSFDGGQTWRSTLIPGYPQDQSPAGLASPLKGYQAAADPTVRPGTNGLFYYSGIAFDRGENGKSAVFVSRFIDNNNLAGGDPIAYLGTIVVDAGNKAKFLDKPYIAVDIPRPGGPTCTIQSPGTTAAQTIPAGAVYMAYQVFSGTDAKPASTLMMTRSLDCGATWSKPSKVKDLPKTNQGVQIAIAPATGEVYLTWRAFADKKLGGDAVLFSKSGDLKKLTFKDPIAFPIKPFDQGTSATSFRTNAYPTIAVDGTGRIYLTWTERGLGPESSGSAYPTLDPRDARVVMTTSRDGVTWTDRQPIENNPTPGHQIMPVVSAIGGKISVVYYDLREDVSKVFKVYIDENDVTTKRHTLDLRVLQADPADVPAFAPSVRVSEYMMGVLPDQDGPGTVEQLQFNVPNLPLFAKGTSPFMGDFIDLSGEWFTKDAAGNWTFNTNGPQTMHAFWTDNRDVRPPLDGNWQNYTPPNSEYTQQTCKPGQTGMRNSNVYSARITPGLLVGSPTNSKRLLQENGQHPAADRRSFVVFAQNNTDQTRLYRFTILNQPVGGIASFLQFSPIGSPLENVEMEIAPRSTASRTVYVSSSDPTASVKVDISEVLAGGTTGLTGSVTLNPDKTNPTVTNPTVTNAEVFNPTVTNPTVTNPTVTNPTVTNPTVTNPTVTNVVVANPTVTNPTVTNPTVTNPTVTNSDMVNPTVTNQDLMNGSLTDTTWTVKNEGNTAGSFAVKTLLTKPVPTGFKTQLLVYKTRTAPASTPTDCVLKTESQMVLVASIPNPTVTNPTVTNPTVTNSDVTNPTVTNASLWLDVGEEAKVTFRLYNPPGAPLVTETVTPADGTPPYTVTVSTAFNPEQVVVPTVVQTTVDTADAEAGIIQVTPVAPLIITTTALTDAAVNSLYNLQLASTGGFGAVTWTISDGALPPGLQLSPAGLLSGTPTVAGSFALVVQATDSDTPTAHVARLDMVLRVAPTVSSLSATTLEDQAVSIGLLAAGFNNALLGFSTTSPQHGTLSGTAPNLTYTPASNYNGPDSFTYTATISTPFGPVISASATVSITVTAVNDVPVANNDTATTPQPNAVVIPVLANDTDAENDPLTVASFTQPANGTVGVTNGGLLYTPNGSFFGSDAFTYRVQDPSGALSNIATVSITVQSTNPVITTTSLPNATMGAPYSQALTVTGAVGTTTWSILPLGNLPPGITLNTSTGLISGTAPSICSTFSLTVKVTDSAVPARTATQPLTLTIVGPLTIFTSSFQPFETMSGFPGFLSATCGSGPRTWSIDSGTLPLGISLNAATGTFFNPAPNTQVMRANGVFPVTFRVTDSSGFATRTLTFNIMAVDQQPFGTVPGATLAFGASTSTPRVAQTYSVGAAGTLTAVRSSSLTCSAGTLSVSIYRQNGTSGAPDESTLLGSGSVSGAVPANLFIPVTPTQTGSLAFGAEERLATVLSSTGACQFIQLASNDSYSGGQAFADSGGGWAAAASTTDFPLNTLIQNDELTYHTFNRFQGRSVTLQDGRVFILGNSNTAEVFDPADGYSTVTGLMSSSRFDATVTLLADGRVLVAGGTVAGAHVATAEIYDPATNTFTPANGPMTQARSQHAATRLLDGRVLITGGRDGTQFTTRTATTEFFDPAAGTFSPGPSMQSSRERHAATLLECLPAPADQNCAWKGKVLITGGFTASTSFVNAELYNPATNAFTATTGTTSVADRAYHTSTRLSDGRVLIAGGQRQFGVIIPASTAGAGEIYDPAADTFANAGPMLYARLQHAATPLADGSVLLTGGRRETGFTAHPLAVAERYVPGNGFVGAPNTLVTRFDHSAARLNDGRVVIGGGSTVGGSSRQGAQSIELYRAPSDTDPNAGQPAIKDPKLPDGGVGVPYTAPPLTGVGGASPYSFALASGILPPGLTLGGATISGTPSAAGTFYFGIRITDNAGHIAVQTLRIRINPLDITSTSPLPNAYVGRPYSHALIATGVGSKTWSLISGSLPAGLTLCTGLEVPPAPPCVAGTISGTPTVFTGTTFTVRVVDSVGQTATAVLSLAVNNPLTITTTALSDAVASWSYGSCIQTSSGLFPLTFTQTPPALPYGLTLPGNCLSGTPRETGKFRFDVQVSDSSVPAQLATATLDLRVGVPDQGQFSIDQQPAPPVISFGGPIELAQVFTPALNGHLLHVQIPVACNGGSLHIELRGVTGGQPNGTVLASADSVATTVAPFQGTAFFRQLAFAVPAFVTRGVPVAIALGSSANCTVTASAATTQQPVFDYSGGDGFTGSTGSWTALRTADPSRPDLPFEAVVDEGGRLAFMFNWRNAHTATLLTTGEFAGLVLVAGGYSNGTGATDLYNPTTAAIVGIPPGRFAPGPQMSLSRTYHTATLMPDGSVLVIGGFDANSSPLASIERLDPMTHAWEIVGTLSAPRFSHTATLLNDGRILIAGGHHGDWWTGTATTELVNRVVPSQNYASTAGPTLLTERAEHRATRLQDGRVLITGGWGSHAAAGAELFDPSTNLLTAVNPMRVGRAKHTATLLGDGTVLIVGGVNLDGQGSVGTAELFDPVDGSFTTIGVADPRQDAESVALLDGRVLIAGGHDAAGNTFASTAIYDPATRGFSAGADLVVPRAYFTATGLTDGTVLLTGGCCGTSAQAASAEIFDPSFHALPPSTVNAPFSAGLGGAPGLTFAIKSGTLPAGLSLNASTGVITGTPAVAGVYRLVIEITDAAGRKTLRELTIEISAPLSVSTGALPDGVLGAAYTAQLAASGGGGARSWSAQGSLPPGLSLSASGILSGTPTAPGTFTFTIHVTDAQGGAANRQLTLSINQPWTSTYPDGGIVHAAGLAVDPDDSSKIYAAISLRGLYKSTNAADSWTSITDAYVNPWPFDRTGVSFFTVLPSSQTFYAISNGRVFKSVNQGQTWTNLTSSFAWVHTLAVDATGSRIFAATTAGVYRSDNGGGWQAATPVAGGLVWSLALDPLNTAVAYAGTGNDGVYKTTDGGNTWTAQGVYLAGTPLSHIGAIVVNPANHQIVYVAGRETGGITGVARSTDGGATWTRLSGSVSLYWQSGRNLIAVDPASDTVFAGTYGAVIKWTEGGLPVTSSTIAGAPVTAVALDSLGRVYAGTAGFGVYRAPTFAMASWQAKTTGIRGVGFPHSFAHSVNLDQTDSSYVYAGSYNGGYRSTNGGDAWEPMNHPNGSSSTLLTHPFQPGTVYSFQYDAWKSTNHGQTWTDLTGSRGGWNEGDLAIDLTQPLTIYMAASGSFDPASPDGIYKTTNGGTTWQTMNTGLPSPAAFHALAIHPTNGNIVFAATQGPSRGTLVPAAQQGIYRTTDGGQTWTHLQGGLPTPLSVDQIVIYPQDPNIMFAAVEMTNGGIYKSIDGGNTWTRVLAENTNAVAVDPGTPSIVYAGTWNTNGFYVSRDGGANWTTYNAGLPVQAGIEAIALDPANPRRVFIATTAGVYQTTFGAPFVDLEVSMIDAPDPVPPGDNLEYAITVSNIGTAPATGVSLSDPLPAWVAFLSVITTQGSCSNSAGTVSCALGSLGPGQSATVTIGTTPGVSGQFSNTATASSTQTDLNPANNTATTVTTAQAPSPTFTATAGGAGGNAFGPFSCPANSVATALKGRGGDDMDRTELWCSPFVPNGYGSASLISAIGGFGGSPYDFTCPSGMALTGVYGGLRPGNNVIDYIGATCRNLVTGTSSQSGTHGLDQGGSGNPFALNCPTGQAVVGFDGRQGALLDAIRLQCR
jgi:hypothetical protein